MLLSFKEFLQETLLPKQYAKYSQYDMLPEARKATDHFFGKGNDDIREEIPELSDDKSEVHRKVEKHLGITIHPNDYKAGSFINERGNRIRLGKVIKDKNLLQEFSADSTRFSSGKRGSFHVTHHRGFEGVADQTNHDQSWKKESCKSIDPDRLGSNHHYIPNEIKHGTVVSFLRDENGKQIARATFQPHHSEDGKHTIYKLESQYGLRHPAWSKHLEETEKKLSGAWKPGMPIEYEKNKNVYDDTGESTTYHPNISADALDDLYEQHKDYWPRIKLLVGAHPNTSSKTLSKIIKEANFPSETFDAYGNKNLDPKEIDRGLDTQNSQIVKALANHPSLSKEHIHKIIKHGSIAIARALNHPNTDSSHIKAALTHASGSNRTFAAQHPKLSEEDRDTLIREGSNLLPELAKNESLKPHHVEQLHKIGMELYNKKIDKGYDILGALAMNPRSSPEILSNLLNLNQGDKDRFIREDVMKNPSIGLAHIKTALNDDHLRVRELGQRRLNRHIDDPKKYKELIKHTIDNKNDVFLKTILRSDHTTTRHLHDLWNYFSNNTPNFYEDSRNLQIKNAIKDLQRKEKKQRQEDSDAEYH